MSEHPAESMVRELIQEIAGVISQARTDEERAERILRLHAENPDWLPSPRTTKAGLDRIRIHELRRVSGDINVIAARVGCSTSKVYAVLNEHLNKKSAA